MKVRLRLVLVVSVLLCAQTVQFRAQRPELVVQPGHSNSINSIAFSPDGKMLASGSSDKTIKLWDVASRTELRAFKGHSYPVNSVAFSPDGKTLASGSDDATIKLWNVASGRELRSLEASDFVYSLAFSPDGRILASGDSNWTIKLWDVAGATELRALEGHSYPVNSVAFSPDGKTLASGNLTAIFSPPEHTATRLDPTVRLWDVASGRELRALKGHSDKVSSVAFSPGGKILASGSGDNTIKLWDAATGKQLRSLAGHTARVNSVAFSPDGKMIASGSEDHTIRFWDALTGTQLRSPGGPARVIGFQCKKQLRLRSHAGLALLGRVSVKQVRQQMFRTANQVKNR